MTDKTKILAEIERLKMNWRLGMSAEAKYRVEAYTELIDFINSLPEEPVSNVWHDAQIDPPQAKKKILAINEYGSCEVDYAINMALYWPKVIKWAYIDDLLKLDNSCQSCENLQEESVSEDLEEVALEWANKQLRGAGVTDENCPRELAVAQASLMVSGFKAGAKWQLRKTRYEKDENNKK